MNKVTILALLIVIASCQVKPEPLRYGVDACYACKMTLMDERYGAEIVTRKGKVYKFDDINCMLGIYHSGLESQQEIAHLLVVNFTQPGQLIDASNSWYLKSDSIRSPMASGLAAFATDEEFSPLKRKWKAILMSWGETNTQFK